MIAPAAALPSGGANGAPDDHAHPSHGLSFHEVLSALNPLQYLPVIGTIYRAVTGDTIPEAVRRVGSLIASALLGGPIGIAINLGVMAFEKVTGIDLENTGQALLHGNLIATASSVAGTTNAVEPQAATPQDMRPDTTAQSDRYDRAPPAAYLASTQSAEADAAPASLRQAWSPAQLAAYGVTASKAGGLSLANMQGSDVLNALELSRLHTATAAYGRLAAPGI